MSWILAGLTLVGSLHVIAIVLGRGTSSPAHTAAFVSGIAGLLSLPVMLGAALMSFCVAGACRRQGLSPMDYAGLVFALLVMASLLSIAVIGYRRER